MEGRQIKFWFFFYISKDSKFYGVQFHLLTLFPSGMKNLFPWLVKPPATAPWSIERAPNSINVLQSTTSDADVNRSGRKMHRFMMLC